MPNPKDPKKTQDTRATAPETEASKDLDLDDLLNSTLSEFDETNIIPVFREPEVNHVSASSSYDDALWLLKFSNAETDLSSQWESCLADLESSRITCEGKRIALIRDMKPESSLTKELVEKTLKDLKNLAAEHNVLLDRKQQLEPLIQRYLELMPAQVINFPKTELASKNPYNDTIRMTENLGEFVENLEKLQQLTQNAKAELISLENNYQTLDEELLEQKEISKKISCLGSGLESIKAGEIKYQAEITGALKLKAILKTMPIHPDMEAFKANQMKNIEMKFSKGQFFEEKAILKCFSFEIENRIKEYQEDQGLEVIFKIKERSQMGFTESFLAEVNKSLNALEHFFKSDNAKAAAAVMLTMGQAVPLASLAAHPLGIAAAAASTLTALIKPSMAAPICGGWFAYGGSLAYQENITALAGGSPAWATALQIAAVAGGMAGVMMADKFLKDIKKIGLLDLAWYPVDKLCKTIGNIADNHRTNRNYYRLAMMVVFGLVAANLAVLIVPGLVTQASLLGLWMGTGLGAKFGKETYKLFGRETDKWDVSAAVEKQLTGEQQEILKNLFKDKIDELNRDIQKIDQTQDEDYKVQLAEKAVLEDLKIVYKNAYKKLKLVTETSEVAEAVAAAIKPLYGLDKAKADRPLANIDNNKDLIEEHAIAKKLKQHRTAYTSLLGLLKTAKPKTAQPDPEDEKVKSRPRRQPRSPRSFDPHEGS